MEGDRYYAGIVSTTLRAQVYSYQVLATQLRQANAIARKMIRR